VCLFIREKKIRVDEERRYGCIFPRAQVACCDSLPHKNTSVVIPPIQHAVGEKKYRHAHKLNMMKKTATTSGKLVAKKKVVKKVDASEGGDIVMTRAMAEREVPKLPLRRMVTQMDGIRERCPCPPLTANRKASIASGCSTDRKKQRMLDDLCREMANVTHQMEIYTEQACAFLTECAGKYDQLRAEYDHAMSVDPMPASRRARQKKQQPVASTSASTSTKVVLVRRRATKGDVAGSPGKKRNKPNTA